MYCSYYSNTRILTLPPMEWTREGPTVYIWSYYPGCSVIKVLTEELDAAIILPWRQGEQTKLLSNLSKVNPQSRPKPLSQHKSQSLDDLISYATSKAQTKTEGSNTSQKIEQMRNQRQRLFRGEKCHKQACQKNQELANWLAKENIQISIDKLRDREQIILELIHKNDIISCFTGEWGWRLYPKVTYSLCDRGVRLENHFLFSVMCLEILESISHLFSRPLSITYIEWEKVDGSVLGLVRKS
jgi:hypothetical protein